MRSISCRQGDIFDCCHAGAHSGERPLPIWADMVIHLSLTFECHEKFRPDAGTTLDADNHGCSQTCSCMCFHLSPMSCLDQFPLYYSLSPTAFSPVSGSQASLSMLTNNGLACLTLGATCSPFLNKFPCSSVSSISLASSSNISQGVYNKHGVGLQLCGQSSAACANLGILAIVSDTGNLS